jgi:signal transduction histidine kinase
MSNRLSVDRLTTHSHRLVTLLSYLLVVNVALRRRFDLAAGFTIELLLILLGIFFVLLASEPLISQRMKSYHRIYFITQMIIVQWVGVFQKFGDTWALLYIILGFQIAQRCARREAIIWSGLFAASLLVTLSAEFGFISGPGRALAYIVIGIFLISYDIQFGQHEDALTESQVLVAELKEANQKLTEYAAKAEELATLKERNRMIQELYDAVGQKVFAIQLAAETTRLMLERDPHRAADQIDDLQDQTQSALGQMRQLIEQWRPA